MTPNTRCFFLARDAIILPLCDRRASSEHSRSKPKASYCPANHSFPLLSRLPRSMAPPQAARLDPRDANCSRLPPCPHSSRRAMRPRRAPLRLAPPAPSRSQVADTVARRVHFCPFAILIQRRPSLPVFRPQPARSPVAARGSSPERRGRDRQRVPAASSRRSRRGVLSAGAALLSPAEPSRSTSLR